MREPIMKCSDEDCYPSDCSMRPLVANGQLLPLKTR